MTKKLKSISIINFIGETVLLKRNSPTCVFSLAYEFSFYVKNNKASVQCVSFRGQFLRKIKFENLPFTNEHLETSSLTLYISFEEGGGTVDFY